MAGERLQKALSRAGLASRREVEDWIRAGRITVNGEPAVLGTRVEETDQVRLDGRLVHQRQTAHGQRAFVCHRSPGENLLHPAETSEQSGSETAPGTPLVDRIPRRAGRRFIAVSPMPRVDGGLELVTSDGDLAARLQRSIRSLTVEFSVRVHGELGEGNQQAILAGVLDSGVKLVVERLEPAGGEGSNRWYAIAARGASGKDVRQLFERQGALVSRVLRTRLGPIGLDRSVSRGRFRELAADEVEALLASG